MRSRLYVDSATMIDTIKWPDFHSILKWRLWSNQIIILQKCKGSCFSWGISMQNIELVLAIFNNNLALCHAKFVTWFVCKHPTGTVLLQYYLRSWYTCCQCHQSAFYNSYSGLLLALVQEHQKTRQIKPSSAKSCRLINCIFLLTFFYLILPKNYNHKLKIIQLQGLVNLQISAQLW